MKSKSIKQILSIVLCTAMVSGLVGCGNVSTDDDASNDAVGEETNIDNETETDTDIDGGGSASTGGNTGAGTSTSVSIVEKVAVDDFYDYVNEDWMNANQLDPCEVYTDRNDDANHLVWDRIEAMLSDADPEVFSPDDPMYKMVSYYDQFTDAQQRDEISMNTIKSMVDTVRNVSNMSQLQSLMEDETYSLFNNVVKIDYDQDYAADYVPYVYPEPLMGFYYDISDENRELMVEAIAKEFVILGYSEAEAQKIAQNASVFDLRIHDYYNNAEGYFLGYGNDNEGWNNTDWKDVDCTIDIQSILIANNYEITNKFSANYCEFIAVDAYLDWLNENVNSSTIEMVTDYYAVNLVDMLAICGSNELIAACSDVTGRMAGGEEFTADDMDPYSEPVVQALYFDRGAVAAYYASHYITDEQKETTKDIVAEVIDGFVEIIDEVDWLNTVQKERLKARTKMTTLMIGCYEDYNHLEDMEVCENLIDTCISLLKSNRRFNQRILVKENIYTITDFNLYSSNACYYANSNTVLITAGFYADDYLWNEASYDELMAMFGTVIAHELGHAYDPSNVAYRNNGEYDDRWDDYWEYYYQAVDKIFYYYNGMQTDFGNVVDGSMVYRESFADIISMDAVMRVLEKHDNVDYPLFFTSYAQSWGIVMRPEFELLSLTQDTHVTNKERVNGVLAQCDKFYEYFDLNTNSKFYLDEADRIVVFEYVEE